MPMPRPHPLLPAAGLLLVLAACGDPALPPGGDFTLQAPEGALDTRTLRGSALLVCFGYAACPDPVQAHVRACAQALQRLPADQRARVRLLLVSSDPWRDTPARMGAYAALLDPAVTGLTGAPEVVAAVERAFGAPAVRGPAGPDGGYDVTHSRRIHVVDPRGRLAAVLPANAGPDRVLSALRRVL